MLTQPDVEHALELTPLSNLGYLFYPVGMVKQPTSEQSEFTMSSEDFPALPGTSTGGAAPAPSQALSSQEYANHNSVDKPKRGIQTSPEGEF